MDLHLSSSSNSDHQKVESTPIPITFSSTTYAAPAGGTVLQLQHGHEGQQHSINPPPPTAALPLSSKPPSSSSFNANINGPSSCQYPSTTTTTTPLMKEEEEEEKDQEEEDHIIIIPPPPPPPPLYKNNVVVMRYRECLKNHAAAMGGNARDGCGEFMPGGSEGTLEALRCSACNCHRNFHRKEILLDHQGSSSSTTHDHEYSSFPSSLLVLAAGRNKFFLDLGTNGVHHQQHHKKHSRKSAQSLPQLPPPPPPPSHQHIRMSSNNNNIYSSADVPQKEMDMEMEMEMKMMSTKKKRRFRTKFTQEQKEKMLSFAEKAGWKIQKQEDSVVQQICQELGIKRRVLKVWMHNNKHNYLAINNTNTNNNNNTTNNNNNNNNNIINSPSTTT